MTSPLKGPKPNVTQNVKYSGSETEFSAEIVGEVVNVQCTSGVHSHGSSKVKLINRSDYNWEFRYYQGNLVAAHINGKVIAYAMKNKDGGMVRVTNQETNQRALIKNLKNDVRDLSFAFSREEIILGCIDDEGNVLIYEIDDKPQAITYSLLLHIFHPEPVTRSKTNFRVIWCPYLPSFDEDMDSTDDPEKMFVVLNGNKAEVYNVAMINSKYGTGPIEPNESYDGYIEITHTTELIDASFSSDGTAIAIACIDGYVKFFQLYMFDNEKQKCLHEWRPHDGKPLSSIIFIDNVLEFSSECWKFTITGANNNSEIKLWSCESWTCLQTIHFNVDPTSLISALYLRMSIDYTGQYIVLSDINNRVLYVLQLNRNDQEQMVSVTMLAQFLLPTPFLSYHITEASSRKVPFSYNNSTEDLYDEREDFDEDADTTAIVLKLLVIQPKKFQECNITFQPEALLYNTNIVMNDACDKVEVEKVPKLDDLQSSVTLLIQQQTSKSQLNLMAPDSFTSPGHNSRPNSVRNSVGNDSSLHKSAEPLDENIVDNLIDFQRPQKDNFASGGSSPSREVQEILSLNNSTYSTQDYFDNIQSEQEEPQKEYPNPTDNLIYQESTNSEMVWPKIPVVKDNEIIKEDGLKDLILSTGEEETDLNKTHLQAMNYRISSLENTIREQNLLMQKLQQDIKTMNLISRNSGHDAKEDYIKELDLAMSKQHLQIAKLLENMMTMQKNQVRDQQEQIISGVTQILIKTLSEKMQQIVSNEMKHVVLPAIHSLIESYKHQIEVQYAQKLTSTDLMLRENISKAVNSKALADSLSLSVVNIVAPSLEKCYRDIISSSLIPSWEKVCGTMFQQINETFTRGTKEYTASVESYMDRQRRVQEKGKDLIVQMQAVSENMRSNADKLTSTLTSEIHKGFNSVFKNMQDRLTSSIKEVVTEEVKQGFKNHASVIEDSVINAVRSRAVTPSPHDSQVTLSLIQQNLSRGNFDEAFQLALSAENLNYVIYVCDKVDINTIFGEECILQQSCILALIQQLSVDISKDTELKLSYIRAAFLSLDTTYHNTKQFVPKVLKELLKQLQVFMATNPPRQHMTNAKLLKMAVENMLSK